VSDSCGQGFSPSDSITYKNDLSLNSFEDILTLPNNEQIKFSGISPLNTCSNSEYFGELGLNFGKNPFFASLLASKPELPPKFSLTLFQNNSNLLTLGDTFANFTDFLSLKVSEKLDSWGFHSRGYRFGSSYEMKVSEILIDPTESLIVAPKLVIEEIFSELLSVMICTVSDFKYLYCSCEAIQNSPELIFYLNDVSISITYTSLFQEQDDVCIFMMSYHDENHWVLGRVLFFEYFLQFDFEDKEISLMKKPKENGEEEETRPILTVDEFLIMIYTVGGCFLFYITIRVIYVLYGWICNRFGLSNEEIQEPLVENFDTIEIAKFKARRSEMSNR